MIDHYQVGNQIALLRKAKGLTGEKFAELLNISAQAVSKWENGKCLPETALLPLIAEILGTSIDSLLTPQELIILNAVFTDGVISHDVTRILNNNVNRNMLYIAINPQFLGVTIDSSRVKVLVVRYQTSEGVFGDYGLENQFLDLNLINKKYVFTAPMEMIGAFYGNKDDYRDCLVKIKHYQYFQWNEIHVNHESFPSSPKSDETEFLTLVYSNVNGIHVISCAEGETLCYSKDNTKILIKDTTTCILPGIEPLEWEQGMDCTWAGSVFRSLTYMGEQYSYENIMGMSGACYRIAFTEVWDWSAVDALVAFDYSTPLFEAIGYEQIWAARIDKDNRSEERQRIVSDLKQGKPVIAINLRIAPEWGVITGYKEDGKILLCRTYFDKEYLNETTDYLESDYWPFLITHFGDKKEKLSDYDILMTSLKTLIQSFHAPCERGYYQGKAAYERWMCGLLDENQWDKNNSKEDIDRRIGVNDALLLNLIDARRCASEYLNSCVTLLPITFQNDLLQISQKYSNIAKLLSTFRTQSKHSKIGTIHYNEINTGRNYQPDFRKSQVALLNDILQIESEISLLAEKIVNKSTSYIVNE